jgi:hypothetical protein
MQRLAVAFSASPEVNGNDLSRANTTLVRGQAVSFPRRLA